MDKKIQILIIFIIVVGAGYFAFIKPAIDSDINDTEIHEETGDHIDEGLRDFEIGPTSVFKKIKSSEDFKLLDVRTQEEINEGYIAGAFFLPVDEISQQRLDALGLKKDDEIIIYCRSGARSAQAYRKMDELGYTNIKSMMGGIIHWEEDGYPVSIPDEEVVINEEPATAASSASISFDKTHHDFGEITQFGGTVSTEFTVSNTGSETLEIGTITTSCSCTSAEISKTEIAPNKEATLTVIFDPDFHDEPLDKFKRTVFIPTNDPENPEAEVTVEVDILEGK